MAKKTRNGYIDLLRFVAACVIMYFHFGAAPFIRLDGTRGSFPSGALFVEFFFMLSGYFAISSFQAAQGNLNIGKFMLKKYVHFLPYTFIAVAFSYTWVLCFSTPSVYEGVKALAMAPFEALLLRNTGINLAGSTGVLWYLSAMLIAMPIVLYAARRFPVVFKEYLVWVLPLCLYGYILHQIGTIRTSDWMLSNLRAIAGLLMGCNIYYILRAVEKVQFHSLGKTLLTVSELLLLALILLFCTVRSFSKTYLDAFCLLLMYLFTMIALSGKSWTSKIHGRFFTYLGKISLPIYCIHFNIINLINRFFGNFDMEYKLLIYTALVFVAAILVQLFVDYAISPVLKYFTGKCRSLASQN